MAEASCPQVRFPTQLFTDIYQDWPLETDDCFPHHLHTHLPGASEVVLNSEWVAKRVSTSAGGEEKVGRRW